MNEKWVRAILTRCDRTPFIYWSNEGATFSHELITTETFYPRDGIATWLSVCLSVTSRSSSKTSGRIELIFSTEAYFDLSCTVL